MSWWRTAAGRTPLGKNSVAVRATHTAARQQTSNLYHKLVADGEGGLMSWHIWDQDEDDPDHYGTWRANWRAEVTQRWVYHHDVGWSAEEHGPEVRSVWSRFDGSPPPPELADEMRRHVAAYFQQTFPFEKLKSLMDDNFIGVEGLDRGEVIVERERPREISLTKEVALRALRAGDRGVFAGARNLVNELQAYMEEPITRVAVENGWEFGADSGAWRGVLWELLGRLAFRIVSWAVERAVGEDARWALDREIDRGWLSITNLAESVAEGLPAEFRDKPYLLRMMHREGMEKMPPRFLYGIFDRVARLG